MVIVAGLAAGIAPLVVIAAIAAVYAVSFLPVIGAVVSAALAAWTLVRVLRLRSRADWAVAAVQGLSRLANVGRVAASVLVLMLSMLLVLWVTFGGLVFTILYAVAPAMEPLAASSPAEAAALSTRVADPLGAYFDWTMTHQWMTLGLIAAGVLLVLFAVLLVYLGVSALAKKRKGAPPAA
jgi:hypothetical protein